MIEVYFDGASNGQLAGGGIYIHHQNKENEFYSFPLPPSDNHIAEFEAFVKALQLCVEKGYTNVSFRTDSQLVDQAVEKQFVKKDIYKNYLEEALQLIDQFDLFFLKWIPTKVNKNADQLSKQAIQAQKTPLKKDRKH